MESDQERGGIAWPEIDESKEICDDCGDRLATDRDHGWVCLTCGEPRDPYGVKA